MKLKKIIEKFDVRFDELLKKVEKEKKKDLSLREEKINTLKKKLKKIESFLKDKIKYFDFDKIKIITKNKIDVIGFSLDKGFYIIEGEHKNFSLRQCLGLFKTNNDYIKLSEEIIENIENILNDILTFIKNEKFK